MVMTHILHSDDNEHNEESRGRLVVAVAGNADTYVIMIMVDAVILTVQAAGGIHQHTQHQNALGVCLTHLVVMVGR